MRPSIPSFFARPGSRKPLSTTWDESFLKILQPKGWKQRTGGVLPDEAMQGMYHGKLITRVKLYMKKTLHEHQWHIRTRKPNVKTLFHYSPTLNAQFEMKTTAACIKEISRRGGFDNYLLQTPDCLLGTEAIRIRDHIRDIIHQRLDAARLAGEKPILPHGITPTVTRHDHVRPIEHQLGDALQAKAVEGNGVRPLRGMSRKLAIQAKYANLARERREREQANEGGSTVGSGSGSSSAVQAAEREMAPGSGQSEELAGIAAS